jgi:hypothetical protein
VEDECEEGGRRKRKEETGGGWKEAQEDWKFTVGKGGRWRGRLEAIGKGKTEEREGQGRREKGRRRCEKKLTRFSLRQTFVSSPS